MKYRLTPYTIFEQGARDYQEDYLSPKHNEASQSDRVFILCDGMGGHSAGEVASRIVCETMSASVKKNSPDSEGSFSDDIFRQALNDAYDVLDDADDGAVKKMGTTMTFLKFHSDGCTVAHIGDSRVYHIRPGKTMEDTRILFQTRDHSLVNDLVRIGEMTPEEARTSRQKNVITRAIQPNMERRSSADIHHISDILPGDYFLMCSDGILENMEDNHIRNIFSEQGGDALTKVDIITKATAENRDNHSAFIIRIDDVEGNTGNIPVVNPMPPVQTPSVPARKKTLASRRPLPMRKKTSASPSSGGGFNIWIVLILLLMVAGLCAWFLPDLLKKKDEANPKTDSTVVVTDPPRLKSPAAGGIEKNETESNENDDRQDQDQGSEQSEEVVAPAEDVNADFQDGVGNQVPPISAGIDFSQNTEVPESNENKVTKRFLNFNRKNNK